MKPSLFTKRVMFEAPLPPQLDIMERVAVVVYVLKYAGEEPVVEVVGYQIPHQVMVEPAPGSAEYLLLEDLCIGYEVFTKGGARDGTY